jgi:hypothetical protein
MLRSIEGEQQLAVVSGYCLGMPRGTVKRHRNPAHRPQFTGAGEAMLSVGDNPDRRSRRKRYAAPLDIESKLQTLPLSRRVDLLPRHKAISQQMLIIGLPEVSLCEQLLMVRQPELGSKGALELRIGFFDRPQRGEP